MNQIDLPPEVLEDEYDPMRLPRVSWRPGDKKQMMRGANLQITCLLISWYSTALSNGHVLSNNDISQLLQDVMASWRHNESSIRGEE